MLLLSNKEIIVAAVGSYGQSSWCGNCINELGFITENDYGQQQMHGPFGSRSGRLLIFIGQVAGFFGRSGTYLDAIGFHYDD